CHSQRYCIPPPEPEEESSGLSFYQGISGAARVAREDPLAAPGPWSRSGLSSSSRSVLAQCQVCGSLREDRAAPRRDARSLSQLCGRALRTIDCRECDRDESDCLPNSGPAWL